MGLYLNKTYGDRLFLAVYEINKKQTKKKIEKRYIIVMKIVFAVSCDDSGVIYLYPRYLPIYVP